MTTHRIITWQTTKTAAGFTFRVYSFDHNVDQVTHATGTFPTRARATAHAKKWVRSLKAKQRSRADFAST